MKTIKILAVASVAVVLLSFGNMAHAQTTSSLTPTTITTTNVDVNNCWFWWWR